MDAHAFRQALGRFATGVTVITTGTSHDFHGMTANAFTSVSLEPPLVLVCVDQRARTCARIPRFGAFGINILREDQAHLSDRFAGRTGTQGQSRREGLTLFAGVTGTPLLKETAVQLECRLFQSHEAGDHVIYVGQVLQAWGDPEARPLLYHGGRYRTLGGDAPAITPLRS